MPPADRTLLLEGGTVFTSEPGAARAQALAIGGEVILAVGSSEAVRARVSAEAEIIDCSGCTVLPGFIDPHNHFLATGEDLRSVDVRYPGVASRDDLLRRIAEAADGTPPDRPITGLGMDHAKFPDGRPPSGSGRGHLRTARASLRSCSRSGRRRSHRRPARRRACSSGLRTLPAGSTSVPPLRSSRPVPVSPTLRLAAGLRRPCSWRKLVFDLGHSLVAGGPAMPRYWEDEIRGCLHGRNPSPRRATCPSMISRARSLRHEPNAVRFVRARDPVGGCLAPWEIRQICDELGRPPDLEYQGGEPHPEPGSSSACRTGSSSSG
jgi:hypothetical protein